MDFEPFPKIPRLNRDIVITEKIDGTNAAVLIEAVGEDQYNRHELNGGTAVIVDDLGYVVQAQSRKRLIVPNDDDHKGADNFGFAGWVRDNAALLVNLLGPGRHFGEWWGSGIQHGYGLISQRNFSLFNPRYRELGTVPEPIETPPAPGMQEPTVIDTVPVLYEGPFVPEEKLEYGSTPWHDVIARLQRFGSEAAPGWGRPEGVIIFHKAAGVLFKVTCENDERPKEVVARETAKVAANGGGKMDW